jgi:hypothetical protein
LGIELWVGDPVKVRRRSQESQDRQTRTRTVIAFVVGETVPQIWVPTVEQRDARGNWYCIVIV